MTDETAANPADPDAFARSGTEADTPAVGANDDPSSVLDGSDLGLDADDATPGDDDSEDVDFEGNKYKVPKAIKDALLREADYRKKTMTLAEERRAVAAERETIAQARAVDEAEFNATVTLANLRQQKAQYDAIDWDAWSDTDPVAAQKGDRAYAKLQADISDLDNRLNYHKQAKAQAAERESATRREATLAAAATKVSDWSPQKQQELETFAGQFGYTKETFAHASADDYALLDLAKLGAQVRDRQKAAARLTAASAATPATEIKGRTASVRPLDDRASTSEWMKARTAALQKR